MVPSWAWIAWGVATLGTFLALEAVALGNKYDGDTLSENVRRWLGIDPPRPVRQVAVPLFVSVLAGFLAWFVPHILIVATS